MGFISNNGVWLDKAMYDEAERKYYEKLSGVGHTSKSSVAQEIAKAREQIGNTLKGDISNAAGDGANIVQIMSQHKMLSETCVKLEACIASMEKRIGCLESGLKNLSIVSSTAVQSLKSAVKSDETKQGDDDDDDDIDLFGSEDEEESKESQRLREERVSAYAAKKSKKPATIAKSSIFLDVKPWDDETDMAELEKTVRKISIDGMVWGASKLVPLAFGIKKLSIMCTVEDAKVSVDELTEKIEEIDDFVQSVDIAAFNKV